MTTLHIFNLCMDAISQNIEQVAKRCPNGAVLGVFDETTNTIDVRVYPSLEAAEAAREETDDPPASPVVPIRANLALML